MADDRRFIIKQFFETQEGNLLESGARKWVRDSASKTTSGSHHGAKSITTDVASSKWGGNWYMENVTITHNPSVLSSSSAVLTVLSIKNLDKTNSLVVGLGNEQGWDATWSTNNNWDETDYSGRTPNYDGRWDEGMNLHVLPGGALTIKGDGVYLKANEVIVRTINNAETVKITYIIAT